MMMKTQIKGTDQMTFVKPKDGYDEEKNNINVNDLMKNLGLNLKA